MKHIEINYHFVLHHLEVSTLRLLTISSSDQKTDIFTKTFPPSRFCDLVFKLKLTSVKLPKV